MILIFIRHPATEWQGQQRYLGRTDIGLSRQGQKQAELVSDWLKNKNISAVYSSNLSRAEQTAGIIARHYLLEVKKDERLNEIDFGAWEGRTFEQIKRREPELAKKYLAQPLKTKIPGGESWLKFKSRVSKALKEILGREKGTVLLVSHSGVNRMIICNLLKLPLSCFWQIKQDIGAINIIEIHRNISLISLINYSPW